MCKMKHVFQIKIADRIVRVSSIYDQIFKMCRDYYVDDEIPCDFAVTIEQRDIAFERKKSEEESSYVYSDAYLETLAVYRKISKEMLAFDTFLFHGSVVAVDGVGYLFTAKSGTGKTTHTRLWKNAFGERAVIVNGDKPLLKVTKDGVYACGTPWCGKEGYGENRIVPLKAICVLERDRLNHIEEVQMKEVFSILFQQCFRPKEEKLLSQSLDLLIGLKGKVRIFRLGCNMDPEAAQVAYEGMR